jgi:hypothetical protein
LARDAENGELRPPAADAESEDESFIGRWSRLKRTGAPPARPDPPRSAVPAETAEPPEPPAELTDEDMPALDTIGEGSDLTPFFSPRVSEELRQAALKRLFRAPKFNLRDGLDDYDDDFRSFEALGDIVTAEMRLQRERAEARLRRELEEMSSDPGPQVGDRTAHEPEPETRTESEEHHDDAGREGDQSERA